MLTRQVISPVSFLRRHALTVFPIAIIVGCLLVVAGTLDTARPELHASSEYTVRDATLDIERSITAVTDRDFGDITVGGPLTVSGIVNLGNITPVRITEFSIDTEAARTLHVERDAYESVVLEGAAWRCEPTGDPGSYLATSTKCTRWAP